MRPGLKITKITQKHLDEYSDDNLSNLIFKIYAPHGGVDIEKIPEPARTVIVLTSAQGVIDYSTDLYYFFDNDFLCNNAYQVMMRSYENIGHPEKADALENVLSLFPNSKPHKNLTKREKFLDKYFGDNLHPTVDWAENVLLQNSKNVYSDAIKFFKKNYTP